LLGFFAQDKDVGLGMINDDRQWTGDLE